MVVQESQRPNVGEVTFPTVLNRDVPRATWYRSDGQVLHGLPCDPYHYKIYTAKGWALSPPVPVPVVAFTPQEEQREVEAEQVPPPTPPKHIHVMQPEIGSPCLVLGCTKQRASPKGKFKVSLNRKSTVEVSNAG